MKEAVIKPFEFTTFQNAEMPMHEYPTNWATYFIDRNTDAAMYFRKGSRQDGKLLSITRFQPAEIPEMLNHPSEVCVLPNEIENFPVNPSTKSV